MSGDPKTGVGAWLVHASTVVGVAGLVATLWQYNKNESAREVARWQRVLLHKAIAAQPEGAVFKTIRDQYIQDASTLIAIEMPKKEVQDDALLLGLLDLQKDRLVTIDADGRYRIAVAARDFSKELFDELLRRNAEAHDEFLQRNAHERFVRELRPLILHTLELESGQYTAQTLFEKLAGEGSQVGEPPVFYDLVMALRHDGLIKVGLKGVLYSTHDEVDPPGPSTSPTRGKRRS